LIIILNQEEPCAMSQLYRVLLCGNVIAEQGQRLLEPVAEMSQVGDYCTETERIEAACTVDAMLVRTGAVTRALVEASPNLKIVARHGVGYDAVDVDACTEHGVLVTITPDANATAVSEHALALMLASARKVPQADAALKAGNWEREPYLGIELSGKTLGLVGLGRVGSKVAQLANAFGMTVLAADPYATAERAASLGVTLLDLEEMLPQADFVSVHAPLTPDTHHIIGARTLALLKETAILVNTARGGLVDPVALYEALQTGRPAAAALDVFESEPFDVNDPLPKLPNVIVTPHVGGQTDEALVNMAVGAAHAILDVFEGRRPNGLVNPEVLAKGRVQLT
jgi:D-3-phosphoglycerate dehydrogenase / 2-oxoglutarate reductase